MFAILSVGLLYFYLLNISGQCVMRDKQLHKEEVKKVKKKNYEELAKLIASQVGGVDNVSSCHHCATRLRLNVLDQGLIREDEVKNIQGVLGTKWLGDQFQIIIGQDVKFLYNEFLKLMGENPEEESKVLNAEKLTPKHIWDSALSYIASTMSTMIPIMIGAGLCKTIAIVLGPDLLGLLSANDDIYALLFMMHNTLMYFLPVLLGYTACKSLQINPLFGIFLGGLLISPDFRAMIGVRDTFTVYFLNVPVADYSSSFLPVILACPILKYVMRFFEKYVPKMLSILLVPTCTLLVMVIVLFGICGPIGNYLGELISILFSGISDGNIIVRIVGATVLCMAWPYLILFGMHIPVVQLALVSLMSVGYDGIIWPTAIVYNFVMMGCGLGAFLKIKDKEDKGVALSAFITSFFGGITEPTMYGIVMRYKKGLLSVLLSCGIGGLLCGIFVPKVFNLAGLMNVITLPIIFVGGGNANHLYGTAILVVSLLIGAICSYFLIDYQHKV